MIVKMYAVYDSKVEAFLSPLFFQSKGQAVRAFTDAIADSSSPISKHPEDFTIFELGSFDDSNAKFDLHATPISVGVAIEFVH